MEVTLCSFVKERAVLKSCLLTQKGSVIKQNFSVEILSEFLVKFIKLMEAKWL